MKTGYNLPLLDTDVAEAKKMFDVNVFALISVTQAFSPLLINSKGTVINIGSIAGKAPIPWQGYYNASKAAVHLLSDQLRLELAPFDVSCICIVTGAIKTKFFENTPGIELPTGSLYTPAKDIIESIAGGSLVEKDAMDVDVYAKGVVENALRSNPTKVQWLGGSTRSIWIVGTFFWSTIWVFSPWRGSNMQSVNMIRTMFSQEHSTSRQSPRRSRLPRRRNRVSSRGLECKRWSQVFGLLYTYGLMCNRERNLVYCNCHYIVTLSFKTYRKVHVFSTLLFILLPKNSP